MPRRKKPLPRFPPIVTWSVRLLESHAGVTGAFYLRRSLLGDYIGILPDAGPDPLLAGLRGRVEKRVDVVGTAVVPDLPRTFAILLKNGERVQWGVEDEDSLGRLPDLGEAHFLFGAKRIERQLVAARSTGSRSPERLREVDRLFWIDAVYTAECLETYESGAARSGLDRLEGHLWRWIDVREMEMAVMERRFPPFPESLEDRGDADDLAALSAHLTDWIRFYRAVRDPLAALRGVRIDRRLESFSRAFVRTRLAGLNEDLAAQGPDGG